MQLRACLDSLGLFWNSIQNGFSLKLISTSSIKTEVYIDVGLVLANLLILLKIS